MPYDVIVIGGGHNGLIAAAYLARAGRRVLVLEAREVVGGACVSESPWPGYTVSSLAYLCSLLQARIIRELELHRHGYVIFPKDPASFSPFPDGRHLMFFQDERRTLEQIAAFSRRDAAAYPAYERLLVRLSQFVDALLFTEPPNLVRRRARDGLDWVRLGLRALRLKDRELTALVRILTQSARDFLDRFFESEALKATLATDGVIGTNGGPSTPGTAYVLLHHVMGDAGGQRGVWGLVRGGMGAVSQALASAARAHGAEIRCRAPVAQILVREGTAYGVALPSGEELHARVIVSNADPKRTFLKLLDAHALDPDFRQQVEAFRCEGSSLKINLALSGLPRWKAAPPDDPQAPNRATVHLSPSMDAIDRAFEDALAGRPSREPMIECTLPTVYDDSLAPPGKHVMGLFVQYAPYRLKDGDWTEHKEAFADRCLELVEAYAPGFKGLIEHRQVISPQDMETEYGLTGGNIFHGEMALDQLFCLRPVAGWARYATPVKNLYLCGSGTHPGGGVLGAPGYNAARAVLRARR